MRGKLMATFALVLICSMSVPVMAKSIGPQKAVNNPHATVFPSEGAELMVPSGGVHEWVANTSLGAMDIMHILDASKARIPRAMSLSVDDLMGLMLDPERALEYEHKWGFVSYEVMIELFMLEGYSQGEAEAMAAMWPDGVYAMFVNVGKSWNS